MESQRIKILLNRYFDATSTVEEENELINYFTSGIVDDELKPYIPMFSGLKELSADEEPGLEEELMNHILETETRQKGKTRRIWQTVTAVAASIMLAILAVNFYSNENKWNDTFSDPQQAYLEASKTLQFVAGKYNKGLAQLRPIKKVDEAATPLYLGMKTLNRGLGELQNIENLTTNIKKQ
jgi:hypothetical protein